MILPADGIKQQQTNVTYKQYASHQIKQILFWFYQIFIFVIAIFIIAYSVIIKKSIQSFPQTNQYKHALQTIQFWKKGYIIDVTAVSTMNCPQGYQPLINHKWSGTIPGCGCSFNLGNYTELIILKGKCDMDLLDNGCTQIFPTNTQKMPFWKGEKLICLKRIKSLNFYNSIFPSTNICSNNTDYQISNYLNVTCPITNISNISIWNDSAVLNLDMIKNNSLYYISNGSYPIADFKISQYAFCPFFNSSNISPNKTSGNYILSNQKLINCQGIDERINIFDSIDQASYYSNNQNIQKIVNSLPGFPQPTKKYMYYLGYISYPQWIYECRISDMFNLDVTTSHLLLQSEKNTTKTTYIATIILTVFFIFFFRTFYIIKKLKEIRMIKIFEKVSENQKQKQKKNLHLRKKQNFTNKIILICIDVGTRVVLFIFLALAVRDYKTYCMWYNQALKCTGNYLDGILTIYQKIITKIYDDLVNLLILTIILLLLDIIYLVFQCIRHNKQNKREIQKKTNTNIRPADSSKHFFITQQREQFLDEKKMAVFNLQNIQIQQNKKVDNKFEKTQANFIQKDSEPDIIIYNRARKLKKKKPIENILLQQEK